MRLITLLAPCLALIAAHALAAEGRLHQLEAGGEERSYKLYVPEGAPKGPLPLMIVMHGGLGNADETERTTGMNRVAQANGFLVAYPNGTGARMMPNRRTWNAGKCCGRAAELNVNDVSFIHAMLADIGSHHPVDRSRVYATGISNGAMMAYRLACELPDDIAAIVPVSGTLAVNSCPGARNIPVLHIHGGKDSNVPYQGGMGENAISGVAHRSVPETLKMIASAHGCGAGPNEKDLADGSELTSWNCQGKAPLQLRLIPNGEHVWPGGDSPRNRKLFGGDFSASQAAWDFVKQFKKNN
ncbi:extracellular catalytic domain type 1 short-chain-length polyhydroxyalkanoate depolymerase [Pseudomonas subflava]|uniref:extracellular catalytic domain type 1 short-chain-length polyhydroxyalkanoate depolymerase n=1 Tax=Pseudomonas subflava TaxID=2952933 RepID=UPI002079E2F3|nr:PHB depolymerase family esterase [Pseudomonas subflava]